MRFDILDEFSTLVPSGRGVFQKDKVAQGPDNAPEAVKRGAVARCVARLRELFRFVRAIGQASGHETAG